MWTYIVIYKRFSPDWFVSLFQVRFWTLIPAFLGYPQCCDLSYSHAALIRECAWETVSRGEINLHYILVTDYWSLLKQYKCSASTSNEINSFYRCKYVRNDASWYKCQLESDAHFLNWYIASLTFFAGAPSESGNLLEFIFVNLNASHWISQRCAATVSRNQLWFPSKAVLSLLSDINW